VVASPLRGPGWLSANGCRADPTSPHRSLLLAADGRYATPEMFAIDYSQVVGGRFYFGIQDRADILTSNSLPFEVDRYRFVGVAGADSAPTAVNIVGTPHNERRSYPLIQAMATYPR
jgi:hypothetical protein